MSDMSDSDTSSACAAFRAPPQLLTNSLNLSIPSFYEMEQYNATFFFTDCNNDEANECHTMWMGKPWQQITKELMREQGRTSSWMADKLGVTQGAYSRWMGGSNNPRIETIRAIAAVLHVPATQLIDPDIDLPADHEQKLLADFRELSTDNQQTIITLIQSLKK
jgi:transcriptional regulator with XRE-family HTH domain